MLTAILAMTALAAVLGLLLGYSAIRFKVEGNPIADQIDALLPRPNVANVVIPDVDPMLRRWRAARTRSTSASPAARLHCLRSPICSGASRSRSRSRRSRPRSR